MADANLDAMIRQLAKQQHKTLTAAVKKQKDRTIALATKAKDADSKQRYRQLAKETLEIGTAAIKRLQMAADNAAYSYARSYRQAIKAAKNPPVKKAGPSISKSEKPTKKAGKKKT